MASQRPNKCKLRFYCTATTGSGINPKIRSSLNLLLSDEFRSSKIRSYLTNNENIENLKSVSLRCIFQKQKTAYHFYKYKNSDDPESAPIPLNFKKEISEVRSASLFLVGFSNCGFIRLSGTTLPPTTGTTLNPYLACTSHIYGFRNLLGQNVRIPVVELASITLFKLLLWPVSMVGTIPDTTCLIASLYHD